MLGDVTAFPFNVILPKSGTAGKNSFVVTVQVPIQSEDTRPAILSYLRSIQVKQDLMAGWVRQHASDCGMEVVGGPRPLFEVEEDRSSRVLAYEQDFRLTRRI
jgi:hypothetical protein